MNCWRPLSVRRGRFRVGRSDGHARRIARRTRRTNVETNRAAVGGALFERATDPRAKPNNPLPSTKGRLFTTEPAANAGEAPANAFARYERMSSTIHGEAITQRSADAPLGSTAISDDSSANHDASLMTARMALLNAEIRGLRDLLGEVKASREELRQDRDDGRRRDRDEG